MCGIAGIVSIKKDIPSGLIEKMTHQMEHRGPDGFDFFHAPKVALGHRRLAIIDLSEGGKQPKIDTSGRYVITFNGEIFNYQSVKATLLPYYPFNSNSDTEVILNAYRHWGKDCVLYLTGQFAFAIWDKEKEELFIARDRVGEKPLYYYQHDDYFLFGSELSALLKSGLIPKELSNQAIFEFLKYQAAHTPETIIKNVFQLPAGARAIFKNSKLELEKYWDITLIQQQDGQSFEDAKTKTKDLLSQAIQGQMLSDVPLGAFLSGGIDSSAIVALMAEQSMSPVNTFSIVFDEEDFDESPYSSLIAKKFNTKHEAIKLKPKTLLEELPNYLEKMDTPSGDGLNTYVVSKAVKNAGITVALSGLGGDELFCGYSSFLDYQKLAKNKLIFNNTPKFIKNIASNAISSAREDSKSRKIAALLKQEKINLSSVYTLARQNFSNSEITKLFPTSANVNDELSKLLLDIEPRINQNSALLSAYSMAELSGYTQNVLLRDSDSMGMAHSLEIRVPFFDHHLIEYVLGLPDQFKTSNKTPKSLLVNSLYPLLPDDIVYRKKKGFSFPWHQWIQNELKSFVSTSIQDLAKRDIFDKNILFETYNNFSNGSKSITWTRIWLLVILENWLKKHQF